MWLSISILIAMAIVALALGVEGMYWYFPGG